MERRESVSDLAEEGEVMDWKPEQKDSIVNNLMDLCSNLDNFRQIIVLTMSNEGVCSVVRKRRDDATFFETYGMMRLSAEDEISDYEFQEVDRPLKEDEEESNE